jgi:ubiquinone/menaquinone biosynthesis C-methylase UbiE
MTLSRWLVVSILTLASACGAPAGAPPESTPVAAPKPVDGHGHGHGAGHGAHADAGPDAAHAPSSHAHDGSPHRFRDAERWSKVFDDPKRDAWQKPDAVIRELRLAPDDVVADLGAGTGYFSVRLARAVPKGRVLAIDNEQSMLDFTRKRAEQAGVKNVETLLATESDPKLPAGVNVVLIVDTYHHLTDRVAYFERVRPKLADGGRVVVVDFKMGKLPIGPPDDHKIARETIESEMTNAGYSLCRSWDGLPYQHTLFFAVRC